MNRFSCDNSAIYQVRTMKFCMATSHNSKSNIFHFFAWTKKIAHTKFEGPILKMAELYQLVRNRTLPVSVLSCHRLQVILHSKSVELNEVDQ